MAYCTNAQVSSEFKGITFSASSSITDTEVDRFIEEADAEIDGKVSQVYTTPITGTVSLIIVRTISIWLVKDRINKILAVKTGNDEDNQSGEESLGSRARQMLNDIVDRKLDLPDATLVTASDGVKDYNYANSIEPTFKRGTVQW